MKPILDWLKKNQGACVDDLAELVAVRSISTDGEHQKEVDQSAELTCEQMRRAGLHNVDVLRCGDSNPYAYGEWLGAPGKPTVFLYAHHDVQPVKDVEEALADAALGADGARRPAVRPRLAPTTRGPSPPSSPPSAPSSRPRAACRSTSRCSSRARRRSAPAT